MLVPQIVAPRGVYESCFYLLAVGTMVLFSVNRRCVMRASRTVRTTEEYAHHHAELTADLDVHDPPYPLILLD